MSKKRLSKSKVNYKRFQPDRPEGLGPCMDCLYFSSDTEGDITNGRCSIVKGKIDEYYTCDRFEKE